MQQSRCVAFAVILRCENKIIPYMNDIFAKDLSGELVSPEEPGYELLIDDIFSTMETAQDVPPMTVVAGNPARIIKTIES